MYKGKRIEPPFFEIGPKCYMYGQRVLKLAKAADKASEKYGVSIIFTPQYTDIQMISQETSHLYVFAQHMDPIVVGRGLGSVLPEAVKAAGAVGVMLNHAEKPMNVGDLHKAIIRAGEVGLISIVCADSTEEAAAIAEFGPDIIVAEPTALIGTGKTSDEDYVLRAMAAIKKINPAIQVLPAAGIRTASDVYRIIKAGAEGTGTTSGIMKAKDPEGMMEEMIRSARKAWDEVHGKK